MAANYLPCPCVTYIADPLVVAPPADPCVTEAQRLGRQTQMLNCLDIPVLPPSDPLTSLTAYWKMEEGNGITREDSHTGNKDLTDSASTHNVVGKIGNAARFIGYPDSLFSADAAFAPGSNSFTVIGWFKPFGPTSTLVGRVDVPAVQGWRFMYDNSSAKFVLQVFNSTIPASFSLSSAITISQSVWYFAAFGYNSAATGLFMSVNGVAPATLNGISPQNNSSTSLIFGRDESNGDADAHIDETGIWMGRVLSDADIAWLYNSGNGRTYPF